MDWLREHWPHYRLAADAIRAAKELHELHPCTLRKIAPSASRILANGTIPKKTRQKAAESLAENGPKKRGPGAAILQTLEPDDFFQTSRALLACPMTDEPEVTEEHRAFTSFAGLVAGADMVHLSIDRAEDADEVESITLVVYRDGKRVTSLLRSSLLSLVQAATDSEPQRRCPKCTQVKPLAAFAKSTRYCRLCERARVKEATQRRRDGRGTSCSTPAPRAALA